MNDGRVNWAGSFAAIVTPWGQDGILDEALLRENVEMTIREGAHGILVGGHNGESHLASDSERKRIWQIGIETVAGRIPVIVGTGGIRTEHVIELTEAAVGLGADGAMVELPYFMTPNPPDVLEHFRAVSEAVEIPIMVYNHPKRTGINMSPDLLVKLAELRNVVAVKDSSGDFVHLMACLRVAGDRVRMFIGPARLYGVPAVVMGAAGFVDGLPQVLGSRISQMYQLTLDGDLDAARSLQWQCFEAGRLLYEAVGTWPATAKDAMRLQGRPGGWPRRPLRPMNEVDTQRLRDGLVSLGLVDARPGSA